MIRLKPPLMVPFEKRGLLCTDAVGLGLIDALPAMVGLLVTDIMGGAEDSEEGGLSLELVEWGEADRVYIPLK